MAGARNPFDDDSDVTANGVPSRTRTSEFTRPTKPFVLELIQGPGAPSSYVLTKEKVVLGRSSDVDMHIDSVELSRHHACFIRADGEYSCTDLNSSNGVFLNGIRIHSAVLREGDQIQLGDLIFLYHEGI